MRLFGKALGRFLILLVALGAAFFAFVPGEPVALSVPLPIRLGDDLETWLATREGVFDDIVPGVEKRIVWAAATGAKTPLSIVYVHGFSATSEEIRPVPDLVAAEMGANLFYTRLAGHGRTADALAGPNVNDWMIDMAEALEVGRALGDNVVILGTSTGATLATLALLDGEMSARVAGIAMISPNFRIKNRASLLLTWPKARDWLHLLVGDTRSFVTQSAEQAQFWTESYPSVALLPMAAMVKTARGADYSGLTTPALILYSPEDQVIDGAAVEDLAAHWGGPVAIDPVTPQAGMDPFNHVIAGDIISPGRTTPTAERIIAWMRGL